MDRFSADAQPSATRATGSPGGAAPTAPLYCGIDIGASAAKLVLIDAAGTSVGRAIRPSGVDYVRSADACLEAALADAGGLRREQILASVSTGYGRENVPWADARRTEIACHARGAFHHFRRAMTVVDIGAQDSKVIHLDDNGRRIGFKMNRKCAAGTGAFLEEIAHRLGLGVDQLNALAEQATRQITLGSFCTVFAATEILEKIRAGERVENIVQGAFRSVVKRIQEMESVSGMLVVTGGVAAYNPLLVRLLGEAFGVEAHTPPEPQLAGALGAALFARDGTEAAVEK